MDTPTLIRTLSDPLGLPFYPQAFQALMVLTFGLHIAFVNLALGATALALWARAKGEAALARSGGRAATAAVSGAILLGVAPLLFVQTLYDPFWYASNMLSAAWALGFLLVLTLGYGAAYAGDGGGWGALSLLCYLAAGAVMHALGAQALAPERWLGWYAGSGTAVTAGTRLYAFEPWRWLHFMVPAGTAAGLFLMLRAWYLRPRGDTPGLEPSARLGARLAFWTAAAEAASGLAWLWATPRELAFHRDPWLLAGSLAGLGLVAYLGRVAFRHPDPAAAAVPAAGATLAVVVSMSAARESLRVALLGRWGFSVYAHRVTVDWGSTALFLGTFVLGVCVLAWVLAVAFQAGRTAGRFTAGPRLAAWGTLSLGLLAAWLLVVAGYGVAVTLRNG